MKQKNGFTLMELLGVIVILAIIVTVVVSIIQGDMLKARNTLSSTQMKNIETAARNWASDHPELLPSTSGGTYEITLSTLQSGGYIDENLKDPKNKEDIEGTLTIKFTYENNQYVITVGE